jgi:hypothetical protein
MPRSRPTNTRVSNVMNFGIDQRLPLGFVDVVVDNDTGLWVGYMRNGSFYPLGVDAAEYEAELEAGKKRTRKQDTALNERGPASLASNPLASQFAKNNLQVTTDNEGRTFVSGNVEGSTEAREHFIYVGSNDKINISANFDDIRNIILRDATTQPGALDALLTSMYTSGLISRQVFEKSIKGSTKTFTESYVTKRSDAADDADRFFMQYLGRGATKQEEDAYYNALRDLERKNIASQTSTYDADGNLVNRSSTGELVADIDKTLLLGKIAGKAIKGSKIDKLLEAGGQAAGDIQQIMSLANQYGLTMNQEDAMDYVATNLRKGKNIDQTKNKLIKLSQAKYQNISNLIDDDISVKDIATQYIYDMSQVLELNPQSINVNDPMIQSALLNNNNKGTMSITEFNTMLRKDPRWGKTNNARNTAAEYALEILTSFGLVS